VLLAAAGYLRCCNKRAAMRWGCLVRCALNWAEWCAELGCAAAEA